MYLKKDMCFISMYFYYKSRIKNESENKKVKQLFYGDV